MLMQKGLRSHLVSAWREWSDSRHIWDLSASVSAFYSLFLDKYHADLEPSDVEKYYPEFPITSAGLLTEENLRTILSHQPPPFAQWHFAQRFNTAMESRSWPAGAFRRFVRPANMKQLVRQTDRRGRTALHWASERYASWARMLRVSYISDNSLLQGYEEFLIDLLAQGADPHALNKAGETAFVSMFRELWREPGSFWSPGTLFYTRIAQIVKDWGVLVTASGLSLRRYVEDENSLQIQCLIVNDPGVWDAHDHLSHQVAGLVLLDDGALAVSLVRVRSIKIWACVAPPGAWAVSPMIPDRICWTPREHFEHDLYSWHVIQRVPIETTYLPLEWSAIEQNIGPRDDESPPDVRSELFDGTQDDIGSVFTMVSRGRSNLSHHRRSLSSPPSFSIPAKFGFRLTRSTRRWSWYNRWLRNVHKCPLDSRWYPCTEWPDDDGLPTWEDITVFWRTCMHGECERWNTAGYQNSYGDCWEAVLFRDKSRTEVALRFARKFGYDSAIYIIETVADRARRESELIRFRHSE